MISIILTSYKEPATIAKAISCLGDINYSGIDSDFEIIQISPDEETLKIGKKTAIDIGIETSFKQIVDPHKGKPHALNLGLKKAKGEIIILTDGDVSFEPNAIRELLKPFEHLKIGGVTGHPIPTNDKNNYWGYLSHLLTSAADHKRKKTFKKKQGTYYISTGNFFPLSGYIFAIRNINLKLPNNLAIDDTFISHAIFSKNYKLTYTPLAKALVKFPTSYSDYMKQRKRNLAGHIEMKKHKELEDYKNKRSFVDELKYIFFPIQYAQTPKEYIWSLTLYLLRLLTWLNVLKLRITSDSIMKKTGWERTETTK